MACCSVLGPVLGPSPKPLAPALPNTAHARLHILFRRCSVLHYHFPCTLGRSGVRLSAGHLCHFISTSPRAVFDDHKKKETMCNKCFQGLMACEEKARFDDFLQGFVSGPKKKPSYGRPVVVRPQQETAEQPTQPSSNPAPQQEAQ